MIFWAKLDNGELKKIEASARKEAINLAKKSGYRIHKVTKDGGFLFNEYGKPK